MSLPNESVCDLWPRACAFALCLALLLPRPASAGEARELLCQIRASGSTIELRQPASADPYEARPLEVVGRFRFKAVVTGAPERITDLAVTVSSLEGKVTPRILHQWRQHAPFPKTAGKGHFGWQRVYAEPLGRELSYACALVPVGAPWTEVVEAEVPSQPEKRPSASPTLGDGAGVLVAWMGDVMLADGPGRVIRDGQDPFRFVAPRLQTADLRVANLECVVAEGGQAADKPWTFRAEPGVLPVLKKHVDAVSLANNHSGDYGRTAFAEMLDRFEKAGVPWFGGGRSLREAHRPHIVERKGLRIALLGYEEMFPRDFEADADLAGVAWSEDAQVVYDIQQARQHADLVIPFMHWGQEHDTVAHERQRQLARLMIDAGAAAVVGSHPHVVQDTETYKGRPVIYSLGNFVFDGFSDPANNTGLILWLDLNRQGVRSWRIESVQIDADGVPHPAQEGPDAKSL